MISLSHEQKQNIGFTYVMDQLEPASSYGREALRNLRPAASGEEVELELDNINKTLIGLTEQVKIYTRIEQLFRSVKNIRGSISRCGGEALGEVDLFEIKRFLLQLCEIAPLFSKINTKAHYHGIAISELNGALELLDPEGNRVATFYISGRYSPALTAIRNEKLQVEQQIRTLSVGEENKALMNQRSELAAREQAEEDAIRFRLSRELRPYAEAMIRNADAIGRLDLTLQKAKLAVRYGACHPIISENGMRFVEMTNPQLAYQLMERGNNFTPLTIELRRGATVITGANMGGKSVALKTVALNVLLVHYCFYVFAQEATCEFFDSMHIISEDLEAADRGLSSFGGEIVRLQEVLQEMDKGFAFVLMDEFARGTNPEEGAAIARGVVAYLNSRNCVALLSTHYEGVAELAGTHYQVIGLERMNPDVLEEEIANIPTKNRVARIAQYMDYGLVLVNENQKPPRDALNICRLLGLDDEIMYLIKNG